MASSLRTDEEFVEIYNRHVDTVYRVCFSFMKNAADTEDRTDPVASAKV